MNPSPGPFERRTQTLWACCLSLLILTMAGGWQDTMAGVGHEDVGLMPHQEGVRQRSPARHKAQGSTANSMAGSDEARPHGERVSAWMGGCSQGPSILENYC